MKLGAEPKKIAVFAGLIVLAAILHFSSDDGRPSSSGRKEPAAPVNAPLTNLPAGTPARPRAATQPVASRPNSSRRTAQDFKPVLRPRRVEDRIDPASIDPTLRTDLLSRLATIQIQGGNRPLFEFSAAPPPKAPDPGKISPVKPGPTKPVSLSPPKPPIPTGPVTPPKPQAPPIPLKFYGFTAARAGEKRVFFLENEDVYVASVGEIVKKRYKVVRVNLNSVVMEDTQFKQEQTLPLVQQLQ